MVVKRFFRHLYIHAKLDLMWLTRDTAFCLIAILTDFISNAASIAGVYLLAARFGGVRGMSVDEVVLMLGYATLVKGLMQLVGGFNTSNISRVIGRSQLDHFLVQPVSIPLQLMTRGFIPFSGSGVLISGILIIIWALKALAVPVTPALIGTIALQTLISTILVVAQSYIAAFVAFYYPVAGEEISSTSLDLNTILINYPLSGMSITLKVALCTVLPVGLVAWFPASALLNKMPFSITPLYPAIVALLLAFAAAALFRKGLNHYVKSGIQRYRDMGHRR